MSWAGPTTVTCHTLRSHTTAPEASTRRVCTYSVRVTNNKVCGVTAFSSMLVRSNVGASVLARAAAAGITSGAATFFSIFFPATGFFATAGTELLVSFFAELDPVEHQFRGDNVRAYLRQLIRFKIAGRIIRRQGGNCLRSSRTTPAVWALGKRTQADHRHSCNQNRCRSPHTCRAGTVRVQNLRHTQRHLAYAVDSSLGERETAPQKTLLRQRHQALGIRSRTRGLALGQHQVIARHLAFERQLLLDPPDGGMKEQSLRLKSSGQGWSSRRGAADEPVHAAGQHSTRW